MAHRARQQFIAEGIEIFGTDFFQAKDTSCSTCRTPDVLEGDGRIVKLIRCSHEFHHVCLMGWLDSIEAIGTPTCPLCRATLYGTREQEISRLQER